MTDTVTIPGVEVLRVGTYTGISGGTQDYSIADLDEMVEAWDALEASGADFIRVVYKGGSAEVPVGRATVGHNDVAADGAIIREAPVVGRLAAVRRKGETLVVDLVDIPAKLAGALRTGYPSRSIEGFRLRFGELQIGDRVFRQAITGLALLGEHLPAVTGLADLPRVLAEAEGSYEVDVPIVLAEGIDQKVLDKVLAALDAWAEMAIPLVAGARGAPILRMRIRSLKEGVQSVASGRIANEQESDMTTETDASAGPVQNAVADAATALAIISEILGMPDAMPADIVAKVRELVGGADTGLEADDAVQNAAVVALEAERDTALTRIAALEGRLAREDAARDVDALMLSGKAVPAQRDTLIALRLANAKAFADFAKAAPTVVVLGESGTSSGDEVLTPAEIQAATDNGRDLEELRAWKRSQK